ncbi:efflux RND transporter periplasmic adaptor subunit [Sulfitobacter guttiformis]|uniref:Membrane fusion protein (Multidrug efflux system) n=1 Tax=Sulfitobacter guttiformis TaxID=74349 RepID=A0A420DTL5_9RHOB|nr:efflux RND transporter periplasmic adaptor subunit [Sulfitobacter guttiformis]KIN71109.1 Efflux transporter, RND family, MFP subunit [Sulfitobacter guttiformis KCTC 32187]RKE97592.1 membrane fusion protein (multidrug efflux system) [Sulfitobacter guttiformis]
MHITTLLRHSALVCLALTCSAFPAAAQQQGRPPPAVTVMTLQPQDVTLTTTLPGRVVASATAEVRPQVAGIVTERLFQEGGTVAAGDVLYQIDPASYEAALAQADASVAQAQAQLNAAQKDETRQQELASRNVASTAALDLAIAARDTALAGLQAAQAQRNATQIELDRTKITARLSGEIGRSLTSKGALVTASQATPMAVIRNIETVYVDVTQSAAEIIAWRRGNLGERMGDSTQQVTLTLADGSLYNQTGQLTAAEPDVDEQTGVVVLRMSFDNPDKLLLPGMYVQVEMPTRTVENVFLIPQEAVSRNRRGQPIAMVVGANDVVESRELTVLQDMGSDWAVSEGLVAGDRIVTVGLQKASPGATVTPQDEAAPEAEAPASTDDQTAPAETSAQPSETKTE